MWNNWGDYWNQFKKIVLNKKGAIKTAPKNFTH